MQKGNVLPCWGSYNILKRLQELKLEHAAQIIIREPLITIQHIQTLYNSFFDRALLKVLVEVFWQR